MNKGVASITFVSTEDSDLSPYRGRWRVAFAAESTCSASPCRKTLRDNHTGARTEVKPPNREVPSPTFRYRTNAQPLPTLPLQNHKDSDAPKRS